MTKLPSPSADKRALRNQHREARRTLSTNTQQRNARDLARHFFSSTLVLRAQTFAAYLPNDAEIDPTPLLQRLSAIGKGIQLPRILRDWRGERMLLQDYRAGDPLEVGRFNMPQPTGPLPQGFRPTPVVLAPLVAYDQRGYRLGMGGGFYDRYLAQHPGCLCIGLAHSFQEATAALPTHHWDQPLDAVITERGWQWFSPPTRLQENQ